MLHIIADIIVCDVQLVKLQTRREKAGKDSRLHKPKQNKQVSLKLGCILYFVFWPKFYFRFAFLQVLVGRSVWSLYLCFI